MSPAIVKSAPEDVFDVLEQLDQILRRAGFEGALKGVTNIHVAGADPLVKSSKIRFGATAVLPPLAVAALASHVHFLRTGETQALSSDTRVAIHNLSIYWRFKPTLSGKTHNKAMLIGNPFLHDTYLTKDNRRIMLCAVYPELRLKWYSFLKVPPYPAEAVVAAVKQWNAFELEDAAEKAGLPCTVIRTPKEYLATAQAQVIATRGPCCLEQIGEAPPKAFPPARPGQLPLDGLKVLMATHAIAGPSAGRALAAMGAKVLQVFHTTAGFEHEEVYNEANIGCRSCQLDFADADDKARFFELVAESDAYIESFRLDSFAKFGITNDTIVAANPSIVICNTKLYGPVGPWKHRPGFDMNAACATGVLAICGGSDLTPEFPELKLINDFTTGYFGAVGILSGLIKRAATGGAWRVTPSLAATAHYYAYDLGLVPDGLFESDWSRLAEHQVLAPVTVETDTPKGRLHRLGHPVSMSKTPCKWQDPILVVQGSNPPTFSW